VQESDSATGLVAIKAAHTLILAFFAACIVAIPVASWQGENRVAV